MVDEKTINEAMENRFDGIESCVIVEELLELQDENAELKELLKEFLSATPDCGWRKCWNCGKEQIHREQVTPSVLCRFCGSQDTRLLKEKTQVLKDR